MVRLCVSLFLIGLLNIAPLAAAQDSPPQPAPVTAPVEDRAGVPIVSTASASKEVVLPLEVTVNGTNSGQWALLQREGLLFAPANAFEEWRLHRRPNVMEFKYRGQIWYPLNSIPGFEAKFNLAAQSVALTFAPTAFTATRVVQESLVIPDITPAVLAGFMNYDVNLSTTRSSSGNTKDLGAVLEFGLSGSWGVVTSSHVGRSLISNDPNTPSNWRRLETVYKKDFPASSTSVRVGDTATRTSLFGNSLYFGGVQVARNFALRPGFITQPIPVISGTSSASSTVDLYINDALRQTSNVPSGPFAIDSFPIVNGAGEARIVIRDLLGRETVLVQPFFTHSDLLEVGLSDWSFELGRLRNNLGTDNANYGMPIASGLWRQGITKSITLAGDFKRSSQTTTVATGGSFALPFQALGTFNAGVSRSSLVEGRGKRWSAGVEYSGVRHSATWRIERSTPQYRESDWEATTVGSRSQISASYSYSSAQSGSIGFGIARTQPFTGDKLSSISVNYSMRFGARGTISFSLARVIGSSGGKSIGISLIFPFDDGIVFASSVTKRGDEREGYASASRALGSETGFGWRVLAGMRAHAAYSEGGVYYQGSKALVSADLSASPTQQAMRLGTQGGFVAMDGRFFASRKIEDSFALVEVPGYPNIGVGFQGSTLTRTNDQGVALITRLAPYQTNSIRLNPAELPISAELDSIEQTAVPAANTGVKIIFPVRSGRAALIKIVLDDGEPAPAGAEIELVGDKKEFFVARRGEAFVTGLQPISTLKLKWKDGMCSFAVELPKGDPDTITRVGPVTCSGVTR